MGKIVTIQIDELVYVCQTSYHVSIDGRVVFLSTTWCKVDENDLTAEVPMWLIEKEGLEDYIVE